MSARWLFCHWRSSVFNCASSFFGSVPGLTRPIMSSQCELGTFSRVVSPSSTGSCDKGIQKSGIDHARRSAPKNPGAATPITVNGLLLIWNAAPITVGSLPYFETQAW